MGILDELSMSRKQIELINHGSRVAPSINLAEGCVRSGKTVGLNVKFMMEVAEDKADGEVAIFGRTRETIYRNIIAPMMNPNQMGEFAQFVKYNPGAPTASILGRTVHVIGTSDARAEQVIRGLTLRDSLSDELTLFSEETYNMIVSRHSVEGAWIGATTNPDGPAHWVKKQIIDRQRESGHHVSHFTPHDNVLHLPPNYMANLRRQYTGLWARRFIDGQWAIASGAIYEDYDDDKHTIHPDRIPDISRYIALGIDYGDTNPTAGILIGLGEDGRLYALHEWAPGKGSPSQRVRWLREWLERIDVDPELIFVDPSATALKGEMLQFGMAGFNAQNDHDQIKLVSSLLSTGQLLISTDCSELRAEIPGYIWDPKAAEKGRDEPVKKDDHFCDALRYAVVSSSPIWRPYLNDALNEIDRNPTPPLEAFNAAA